MPDISTKATVNIEVNSQSVKRRLAELENQLSNLNKKKAEFERTGNTAGLVKIEKEINKVSRQMNTARTNAQKCEAALQKLNSASPKELRMVLKQLQNDLNHIERGSAAWNRHVEAIKRVKAEIKSVDAELREHEGLLSRINRKVNEWGMSIASAAAAFTGLVFTARQAVQAYADMEAEMANVRKFTGMTADEVVRLNDEFKKIDTRTSREDLNKLAQEAGRLGLQSQEDVLGFVKAANQINVALDDLGEGATLTLSKLTDIFGDKDRLGVEQSLLSVGSVINELSQNCTASAPYLAQFAQRLAGVGKQANMTIPQIMGFAAVLDSQGQAVVMSATALSQLIMKLFQDPAKIAKATGMDLQKFSKVLKEDTNEALIMLFERLHELGNLNVLAPVFDAMGPDGARASQVIAALAGNVDVVKRQQLEANKAFKEGTSITKEYNVQNNTVQAQLDKAKKRFHEMAVELGEKLAPAMKYAITGTSAMMRVLSTAVSFISNHKALVVSLTVAIVAYTLATKASAMAQTLWNAAQKAANVVIKTVEATVIAVKYAYYLLTDQLRKADVAQKALNRTMKANPYGLVLAALSLLIGGIIDLTERAEENRRKAEEARKEYEEWKESLVDIGQASADYCAGEITRLKALYKEATNEALSRRERIKAANELQSIYPTVFGNLSTEAIMTGAAAAAYDNLTQSIINSARARAAAAKIEENERQLLELEDRLEKQKADRDAKQKTANEKRQQANKVKEENKGTVYGAALGDTREMNSREVQSAVGAMNDAGAAAAKAEKAAQDASSAVATTEKQIQTINQANESLAEKYKISSSQLKTPTAPSVPSPGAGFKPVDEKAAKKAAAEEKKRQREAEAAEKKRKAEEAKKAKQEYKDDIERVKKNLADQNAAALNAYNKGEIDYVTYLDRKHKASEDYYKAAADVYKKHGLEESDDMAKLHEQQAEEDKKYKEARIKMLKEQLTQERDLAKVAANMEYYNPDNAEAYKNQRVLDEKLAQIDLEYLRQVLKAQTEGSQEYEAARRALEKAERDEELRQRKKLEEDLTAWLYIYSQKGAKDRMDAELLVAKQLYEQKILLEEEYQEAVAAIQKKYRDEVNSKTGTKAKNQDFDDAKDTYEKQMAALEDAKNQGLISQEDYESRKFQIIQNYHNKIVELIKGQGSEWATMVATLVESWKAGFEDLGSSLPEKLKSIADMASAAFAIMNAGVKSYTDYANACRDLELAKVEKNYKAQIDAAGNNDKKKKKLEEQKEKEIAKIKSKYNKQAMVIEMAQAVASTAMAAINAYASAAQVPMIGYILGPIAAGLALAAGAIQIATIKKSHQAQQMGYYEGGFTSRDGNNRREAGVVHANEFVANHNAVSNPQLLPVLRLIDQAQRNNTVGSLTREDVSRAIGQGAILGDMTVAQQRTAEQHDTSMVMVAASMERQTDAINELNARLADGIESFMIMDGERGFDRSWQHYQRMKNNPKR